MRAATRTATPQNSRVFPVVHSRVLGRGKGLASWLLGGSSSCSRSSRELRVLRGARLERRASRHPKGCERPSPRPASDTGGREDLPLAVQTHASFARSYSAATRPSRLLFGGRASP